MDSTKQILFEILKDKDIMILYEETFFQQIESINLVSILLENFDSDNISSQCASFEMMQLLLNILSFKQIYQYKSFILNKLSTTLICFSQQVRFTSINFLTEFYQKCLNNNINLLNEDENFIKNVLNSICLNRYVPVEGIKNNSLKLWKLVVGNNGIFIIKKNFLTFYDLYVKELGSTSHLTREASCRCLQELFMKVYEPSYKNLIKVRFNYLNRKNFT